MNNSDVFIAQAKLVVLSTDIANNQQFILSLDELKIELPFLDLTHTETLNIEDSIRTYLKGLVVVSDLEMIPQLISINDPFLPNKLSNSIYIVYGFLISLTPSLNNCYWHEFQYMKSTEYSNLIFRTIQSLS
jgi:hypothetical protein